MQAHSHLRNFWKNTTLKEQIQSWFFMALVKFSISLESLQFTSNIWSQFYSGVVWINQKKSQTAEMPKVFVVFDSIFLVIKIFARKFSQSNKVWSYLNKTHFLSLREVRKRNNKKSHNHFIVSKKSHSDGRAGTISTHFKYLP